MSDKYRDAAEIKKLLGSMKFLLTSEKVLQDQIASVFQEHGIIANREYRLGKTKDIVDFFIPDTTLGGLAVEVKIKGSPMAIFRQLEAQASYPEVKEIMLVTAKEMKLPLMISDKRAFIVCINKSWF